MMHGWPLLGGGAPAPTVIVQPGVRPVIVDNAVLTFPEGVIVDAISTRVTTAALYAALNDLKMPSAVFGIPKTKPPTDTSRIIQELLRPERKLFSFTSTLGNVGWAQPGATAAESAAALTARIHPAIARSVVPIITTGGYRVMVLAAVPPTTEVDADAAADESNAMKPDPGETAAATAAVVGGGSTGRAASSRSRSKPARLQGEDATPALAVPKPSVPHPPSQQQQQQQQHNLMMMHAFHGSGPPPPFPFGGGDGPSFTAVSTYYARFPVPPSPQLYYIPADGVPIAVGGHAQPPVAYFASQAAVSAGSKEDKRPSVRVLASLPPGALPTLRAWFARVWRHHAVVLAGDAGGGVDPDSREWLVAEHGVVASAIVSWVRAERRVWADEIIATNKPLLVQQQQQQQQQARVLAAAPGGGGGGGVEATDLLAAAAKRAREGEEGAAPTSASAEEGAADSRAAAGGVEAAVEAEGGLQPPHAKRARLEGPGSPLDLPRAVLVPRAALSCPAHALAAHSTLGAAAALPGMRLLYKLGAANPLAGMDFGLGLGASDDFDMPRSLSAGMHAVVAVAGAIADACCGEKGAMTAAAGEFALVPLAMLSGGAGPDRSRHPAAATSAGVAAAAGHSCMRFDAATGLVLPALQRASSSPAITATFDSAAAAAAVPCSSFTLRARAMAAMLGVPLQELLALQAAQRQQQRPSASSLAGDEEGLSGLSVNGLRLYGCTDEGGSDEEGGGLVAVDVALAYT